MHTFWKSKTGKLVMGGCGTQVGMLFTCGALAGVLVLSIICFSFNVLIFGLTQALAQSPPGVSIEAPSPPGEVELLLEEINLLLKEIDTLQANPPPAIPLPLETPAFSSKPVVMATQSGVDLYSGPGLDFHKVGVLLMGETLEIIGRNSDSSWWLVSMPNGLFAWVPAMAVTASNVNETISIVAIPSQLGQPAASGSFVTPPPTATPTATATPTPALPPGTPTPAADQERRFVEDMPSYKRVKASLLVPPVSASISPDGSQIAITERIRLYTVMTDGAHTDIWFEDDDTMGPIGGAVWSPDGKYIAFVVGFKHKYCKVCRAVALLRPSDGSLAFLKPPGELDTDMPRWTQDGRLLVNAHPGEPADGTAYVYDVYGQNQPASGVYVLSSSHEGQKWFPWLSGRTWRASVSERADSYNSD